MSTMNTTPRATTRTMTIHPVLGGRESHMVMVTWQRFDADDTDAWHVRVLAATVPDMQGIRAGYVERFRSSDGYGDAEYRAVPDDGGRPSPLLDSLSAAARVFGGRPGDYLATTHDGFVEVSTPEGDYVGDIPLHD